MHTVRQVFTSRCSPGDKIEAGEVRTKVNALWEVADSLTLLEPSFFLKGDQIKAYHAALEETVYSLGPNSR